MTQQLDEQPAGGAPPPAVSPPAAGAAAPAHRLAVDLSCVQCGYNLRGQTRGERCPECGTPVAASADNRFALLGAPAVRRRARAAAALLWFVVAVVCATAYAEMSVAGDLHPYMAVATAACGVLWVAGLVGLAFVPAREGRPTVWAIRGLTAAAAGVYFLPLVVVLDNPLEAVTFRTLSMALLWAAIACQFALLRRWATDVADRPLAAAARVQRWVVVGVLLVYTSFKVLLPALDLPGLPELSNLDPLLIWPMLGVTFWWATLLGRVRQAYLHGLNLCAPS